MAVAQGRLVYRMHVFVCVCYCSQREKRVLLGIPSKALVGTWDNQDPRVHMVHQARMESLAPLEDLDHV